MADEDFLQESDANVIIQIAELAQLKVCYIVELLLSIREYLQCGNWHPLYTTYNRIFNGIRMLRIDGRHVNK